MNFRRHPETGRLLWLAVVTFLVVVLLAWAQYATAGLVPSKRSLELIAYYETGGRAYYERFLARPTRPPGASGVTVGMGYDLGYNTRASIAKDWDGVATSAEIRLMQSVAGLRGHRAKAALHKVRGGVYVTWAEAQSVFAARTLPRFAALTRAAFTLREDMGLSGDEFGALVSLVFNRGSSMRGSRRREMRWIRYNAGHARLNKNVPRDIRNMKRLWPHLRGLLRRRDAEARLYQRGIDSRR